jgi:hypothetical protein
MLARTETNLTITERWLGQFERALAEGDDALLHALFHADSHWRDVLALTWRIITVSGPAAIIKELRRRGDRARPRSFKVPSHRTAPRTVSRAGIESIEAIFTFETTEGRGSGVVRLRSDSDDTPKAWTLLTSTRSKDTRSSSEDHGRRAKPTRATFTVLIGSITDKRQLNTPTGILPYLSWVAGRLGFRPPLASPNLASTR